MDIDKDEEELDEANKKTKTVKYHQHGTLSKVINIKTGDRSWVFEGPNGTDTYQGEGYELVDIFDELSQEGYELVCGSDDEYILRTKIEIEKTIDYWDDIDL